MGVFVSSSLHTQMTDAALLPALTWPFFAIHDTKLKESALNGITSNLKGKHGLKRFLRDGYGTVLENRNRQHYDPSDLKVRTCSGRVAQ